jgi:NAD+ synthase
VEGFRATNPEAFDSIFHKGNMIARVRANVLSTKAATEKKIVAGTGNKDEDFGIGYYTLFGDGAVHLSPIGGLSKRLVREMASFLGLGGHIVNRVPTAGGARATTTGGSVQMWWSWCQRACRVSQ